MSSIFSIERHEYRPDGTFEARMLDSGWAESAEANAYQRALALATAELGQLARLTDVKHRHEVVLTLEFRNIKLEETCIERPACASREVNFWLNDGKHRRARR